MSLVKVYFDGGCQPNPGKGYGSYEVVSPDLSHRSIRQQFGDGCTNNVAEYMALLAALKWLRHHADPESTKLHILTDSRLVSRQVAGGYRAKVVHIKELCDEVKELLEPYEDWIINWQPRQRNVERFGH